MQPKIKARPMVPVSIPRKHWLRGRNDCGFLSRVYLCLDRTLSPVLRGVGVGGQSVLPKGTCGAHRVLFTPASVRE